MCVNGSSAPAPPSRDDEVSRSPGHPPTLSLPPAPSSLFSCRQRTHLDAHHKDCGVDEQPRRQPGVRGGRGSQQLLGLGCRVRSWGCARETRWLQQLSWARQAPTLVRKGFLRMHTPSLQPTHPYLQLRWQRRSASCCTLLPDGPPPASDQIAEGPLLLLLLLFAPVSDISHEPWPSWQAVRSKRWFAAACDEMGGTLVGQHPVSRPHVPSATYVLMSHASSRLFRSKR